MISEYVIVRGLHVLSSGLVLGGAAMIWLALRVTPAVSVRLLWWFEAIFWGTIGILVFTGLGNIAGFGLPTVETDRGRILLVKLSVILAVVAGSVIRTFVVVELDRREQTETANHRLRWLYAATAWAVAFVIIAAGVFVRG